MENANFAKTLQDILQMAHEKVSKRVSAGGIVFRKGDNGMEVALIATHGGERWTLPKGHISRSETLEETAVREVREETGLVAEIERRLEPIDIWYWWGKRGKKYRVHKVIHYFVMRYVSGDTSNHDNEVDDVRWFAIDAAMAHASYKGERQLLEQVRNEEG